MILIDNKEGLIGDFLGTIPAMQKLAEKQEIIVDIRDEIDGLFKLVKDPNIKDYGSFYFQKKPEFDITFDSSKAFEISGKYNCYMTQAFYVQAGLEFPTKPPKAKLSFEGNINTLPIGPVDYLISPFARSLPESQKWPRENWQELVKKLPTKKFGILGNYKYDNPMYINGPNVEKFYSLQFDTLCRLFKNSNALISVVTGTSHLAFHLDVKNILLTSQTMMWGNNPDAIQIKKPLDQITVEEVISKL